MRIESGERNEGRQRRKGLEKEVKERFRRK
jgi:hypothetical protein